MFLLFYHQSLILKWEIVLRNLKVNLMHCNDTINGNC